MCRLSHGLLAKRNGAAVGLSASHTACTFHSATGLVGQSLIGDQKFCKIPSKVTTNKRKLKRPYCCIMLSKCNLLGKLRVSGCFSLNLCTCLTATGTDSRRTVCEGTPLPSDPRKVTVKRENTYARFQKLATVLVELI